MQKLISVIVPIYNVELYLRECLESIVNQTYNNLEIILVDDGSNDRCPDICDEYANQDPRIHVIHKENEGLYGARKDGIEAAHGEYIGFIDSDDYVEPDMYEKLLMYAEKYEVDVVMSGIIDTGRVDSYRPPYFDAGLYRDNRFMSLILPQMIYTGFFFQSGINDNLVDKLFRREVVFEYQSRETTQGQEIMNDTIVTWPAIIGSKNIYITKECYYHYRVRHDSKKRSSIRNVKGIIERYYRSWLSALTENLDNDSKIIISNQFQWYIVYYLSSKQPDFFDRADMGEVLRVYGGIPYGSKIIVYGAGMVGIQLMRYLKELHQIKVVAWMDRNWETYNEEFGIKSPDRIKEVEYDYVVVAIARNQASISAVCDLKRYGVPDNRIKTTDITFLNKYVDDFSNLI